MEITDDAHKHGVDDLDIEHAVRNAIRVLNQGDRDLYIGADRSGRLLEVVVLDDDGQPVAIHAMTLRPSSTSSYEHPEVVTMPRTREQLQQAAENAERWLDSLDTSAIASPEADASYLRCIGAGVRAVATSQAELAQAVAAAREHGHTWTQIATMLGTTRQAAQERYGEPVHRS